MRILISRFFFFSFHFCFCLSTIKKVSNYTLCGNRQQRSFSSHSGLISVFGSGAETPRDSANRCVEVRQEKLAERDLPPNTVTSIQVSNFSVNDEWVRRYGRWSLTNKSLLFGVKTATSGMTDGEERNTQRMKHKESR